MMFVFWVQRKWRGHCNTLHRKCIFIDRMSLGKWSIVFLVMFVFLNQADRCEMC